MKKPDPSRSSSSSPPNPTTNRKNRMSENAKQKSKKHHRKKKLTARERDLRRLKRATDAFYAKLKPDGREVLRRVLGALERLSFEDYSRVLVVWELGFELGFVSQYPGTEADLSEEAFNDVVWGLERLGVLDCVGLGGFGTLEDVGAIDVLTHRSEDVLPRLTQLLLEAGSSPETKEEVVS